MIISHQYRFIFIKTVKTAGTSIEIFLSQQCGPEDIVTPIFPAIEGHQPRNYTKLINPIPELLKRPTGLRAALRNAFRKKKFYNHMPASLVQEYVPDRVWQHYLKFCVERNPWDKVLSHYHMQASRAGGSLSLDEYLRRQKFPINYFRYTDATGKKIIVDRVLRYENLDQELADVFARLNVPFQGSLRVKAKSEHRTDHRPYQLVFNEAQRKIVEEAFAREIELHGYRFEQNP